MYQLLDQQGGAINNHKNSNIELEQNNTPKPDNDRKVSSSSTYSRTETNTNTSTSRILTGDYMNPLQTVQVAIQTGYKKAKSTSFHRTKFIPKVLSSALSGSYLGFAITLTMTAMDYGWDKVSASLLFPFGFLLLILSGNSLATGNFALLPMALINKYRGRNDDKVKDDMNAKLLAMNWLIVYLGNFVGTLLCLFILWGGMTHFGKRDENEYAAFKEVLCAVGYGKVVSYSNTGGAAGWFGSMFNGMLANWLVTLAVLLSISSKTTIGKVISVYLPISIFVALGFEHAIVNLFVLPAGLVYKCDTYTFWEWWWWNQIPVTIGNIVGGASLTGVMYYAIYDNRL